MAKVTCPRYSGWCSRNAAKPQKPVEDALAVIEPVHGEHQLVRSEEAAGAFDGGADLGLLRGAVVEVVVDPHGQGVHADHAVAELHLVEPEIEVQDPFHRADEMAHVVVRVEGHEVGAQQPPQHFGAFGQDAEQFVGGEGNVVEVADLQFGAGFPQHARQEHQLVVLHPYDVARLGQPADRLAEKTVHGAVGLAVARLVAGIGEEVVAQGPDRAVAVTFVVVGDLAGGEEDGVETQGLQFVGRLPAALFPLGQNPGQPIQCFS